MTPQTRLSLQRHGANARKARELRDQAIIDAHEDGMSLRVIAEAVGLSHTAIARIVKKS
jgi:transposase-like protein